MKRIIIIAGPNGAGKTTFAKEFLPQEADCPNFINADLIAAGLSPFDPSAAAISAGRVMLAEMRRYLVGGENFAFETTLSGRSYAQQIREWQSMGYWVKLIYLRLRSTRLALQRIRSRVKHGGHSVSSAIVRRRFDLGWKNFEQTFRALVNEWLLYDNSGTAPVLISWGRHS